MIQYRFATKKDTAQIAHLHTQSWQQNYRGVLSDHYLDVEAASERLDIWTKRFTDHPTNQLIIVAEEKGHFCGFACTYLNHDPKWGALLDNLHVSANFQSRGIGRALMQQTAQYFKDENMKTNLYLWVLENNDRAIAFYERIGGKKVELSTCKLPGIDHVSAHRIVWENVDVLL